MGGMKGYMRIIEVVITLVLLFTYTTMVIGRDPPTPQGVKNTRILTRQATDLKNMVCNSEKDRRTITKELSLSTINTTLYEATPRDLQYQLVVVNSATDAVEDSTGFSPPAFTNATTIEDLSTSSCVISTVWGTKKVVVQLWYN